MEIFRNAIDKLKSELKLKWIDHSVLLSFAVDKSYPNPNVFFLPSETQN